jgi:hypothetical protein
LTDVARTLWQRLYYTPLSDVLRGRFDAALDRRRLIADANLPSTLSELVLSVTRKSKLWRSEQIDVARELISHFQDGLDAGRTPAQLIEDFGDPEQAARLIRRAKKRGRPLVWYLWHYGWIAVAALVVFYALAGLYLVLGRPSIKTDYLAIVNGRAYSVPEDQRAWPLYREGLRRAAIKGRFPKWIENADDWSAMPAYVDATVAEPWLTEHQAELQLFRDAAERPELGFPVKSNTRSFEPEDRQVLYEFSNLDSSEVTADEALSDRLLIGTLLPQLGTLNEIARLLAIDARMAVNAGHADRALANIQAILGISHHGQEIPFSIEIFSAATIQKIAYSTVQEVLTNHPGTWSEAQLRDLAHAIAGSEIDWRRAFEGDRATFLDVIQRLYTDDGASDGRITADGLRDIVAFANDWDINRIVGLKSVRMHFGDLGVEAIAPAALFTMASRREVVDKYDQLVAQQKVALNRPFWMLSEAELNGPVESWPQRDKLRYLPIALMPPGKGRRAIETHAGMRDGVLIGIALESFRRGSAHWPKSLDELVPGYLPQLPVDRITGGPLHYKVVDDRPVVYSVGADKVDNGGQIPLEDNGTPNTILVAPLNMVGTPFGGDWVIWSTATNGNIRSGTDAQLDASPAPP